MAGLSQAVIIEVFNACFLRDENTRLIGGACEPYYEGSKRDEGSKSQTTEARIYCRSDYAASTLHEVAHWCLATTQQRTKDDFGFQYLAPPRTLSAQRTFFKLELPVQALESLFAQAAGIEFRVSADSFDPAHHLVIAEFADAVDAHRQATESWLTTDAGTRAHQFRDALDRARNSHG